MRLYSIIDQIREEIYSLDEMELFFCLQKLKESKKNFYLQLIVSDALKVLTVKTKKAITHFSETKILYEFLKDADLDEVKFYMEDNIEWFMDLYYQSRCFYELPIIDRCLLMNYLLEDIRKKPLVEVDAFFLLDGMIYTIRKDLDFLNDYYKDYIQKIGVESFDRFYLLMRSIFEELRIENKQMFDDNLMEVIRKFYMSYKYTESHCSTYIPNGEVSKCLLEKEELQQAKNTIYTLPELFTEVLSFYFSYENDEELFNKKEVESFSQKHISLEMKKKLNIL